MKKHMTMIFSFLIDHFRKIWYAGVLSAASIYVARYRFEINDLKEINARDLVFLLWLILLFLPLLSEMEFFGVRIKKDLKEVKEKVQTAEKEITNAIGSLQSIISANQSAASINIGAPLASYETLNKILKDAGVCNTEISNTTTESTNPGVSFKIEHSTNAKIESKYGASRSEQNKERAGELFVVRYDIENEVRNLCVKTACERTQYFTPMLKHLCSLGVISTIDYNMLREVYNITTRAIHGEIISDEYYYFVNIAKPEIERCFKTAQERIESLED